MARVDFLVVSYWSFDNHNEQHGTFTIELYDKEHIKRFGQIDTQAAKDWFPDFLKIEDYRNDILEYIEKIVDVQDGSVMGRATPEELYFIKSMETDLHLNIEKHALKFGLVFLCKIRRVGEELELILP